MLKLDEWINFCIDGEAAHLAFQLRQKWNSTFLRRMRCPSKSWNPVSSEHFSCNYFENFTWHAGTGGLSMMIMSSV